MRWVSELRGKYEGEPIWISGADPTLDGFPVGFEIGKTMIALNSAHFKFPKATYTYSNEYFTVARLLNESSNYGPKPHIFAWPLGWSEGNDRDKTKVLLPRLPDVHWVPLKPYPPRSRRNDIYSEIGWNGLKAMVREAKMGDSIRFGGYGTCLHPCIMVAVMMGGNPINVIGCNHRTFGYRAHYGADGKKEIAAKGNYYPDWCVPKKIWKTGSIKSIYKKQWPVMQRGTDALIEGATEIGVTINMVSGYEAAEALCSAMDDVNELDA